MRCPHQVQVIALFAWICGVFPAWGCNLPFEPTIESAQAKAGARKCPVLLLFTGLDWSPRSILLDKRLLEHAVIEKVIEDSFIPVLVDFPQREKLTPELQRTNLALAERFNVTHFPTMIALDAQGVETGRLAFEDETVDSLKAILEGWLAVPLR
jgi:hypothetical protein